MSKPLVSDVDPLGTPLYELKVTLDEVLPPVWRTFRIPASASLFELHCVLQVVMGWSNGHLHEFTQGRKRYMLPDPDGMAEDMGALDEEDFTVADLLRQPRQTLTYGYDFGDGWEHTVALVAIHQDGEELTCIAGSGTCPPEDCGGPGGYAHLLDVLGNKRHPEHRDMKTWLGDLAKDYRDPTICPLDQINEDLADGLEEVVAMISGGEEGEYLDEDGEEEDGDDEPDHDPDGKIILFPGIGPTSRPKPGK